MPAQVFRAGVVLAVRRTNGDVLAFERGDVVDAWQLPQGGIDVGETPSNAAWRELAEETSLGPECVALEFEVPEWIAYEWPEEIRLRAKEGHIRRGQIQRWFFFHLRDEVDCDPRPDGREFVAWKWMQPADLIERIASFRKQAYERAFSLYEK